MLKLSKKIISIMLACIILFCSTSIVNAIEYSTVTDIPTVYIQGYGNNIFENKDDSSSKILVSQQVSFLSDGVLGQILDGITKPLLKGVATGNWTEYCDLVANTLVADLSRFALDKNGEASNGSGAECLKDKYVTNRNYYNGRYGLFDYRFVYDWRLDPCYLATELNDYIKQVKEATGFEKVNLVGRCLGANIALAYLAEFGCDDINSVEFYIPGFDGFSAAGAMYSGKVDINTDTLNYFIQQNINSDGNDMLQLVKALVAILNSAKALELPKEVILLIYDKVYENILPRVMLNSFATMPAFWSIVGTQYYEDAKELYFSTPERQAEYANLIEKIDNYHYNVMCKREDIIKNTVYSGVPVYIFAKYGYPNIPLCEESNYQSDDSISISSQTMGATATVLGDTFCKKYLKNAEAKGKMKYISADHCIDASTGLLPDQTWYIKGSSHGNMPQCIDVMMAQIFNATGSGTSRRYVTVNTIPEYPQFNMVPTDAWGEKLYPLTTENCNSVDYWNISLKEHYDVFFEKLFMYIRQFFDKLSNSFNDMFIFLEQF